jgi:hypothetical protein
MIPECENLRSTPGKAVAIELPVPKGRVVQTSVRMPSASVV